MMALASAGPCFLRLELVAEGQKSPHIHEVNDDEWAKHRGIIRVNQTYGRERKRARVGNERRRVDRELSWDILQYEGIDDDFVELLREIYRDNQVQVAWEGRKGNEMVGNKMSP